MALPVVDAVSDPDADAGIPSDPVLWFAGCCVNAARAAPCTIACIKILVSAEFWFFDDQLFDFARLGRRV